MDTGNPTSYLISLTTYYPRFSTAHLAIESVLNQKCPYEYDVHLYIAKTDMEKNGGVTPPNIEALTPKGLKLFIVEENFLAYKKLVPALKAHPEKTIITVDDDVIYPPDFLHRLIQKSHEFPGCIVCFRGHLLSFDSRGKLRIYLDMMVERRQDKGKRSTPSFSLFPTGVSGVLYPPFSLDEMAVDHEQFMNLSPYSDDIWFKMASLKKETPCMLVGERNLHFPELPFPQQTSLAKFNIIQEKNDHQLQACFARYPDLLEKVRQDCHRLDTIFKASASRKAKILDGVSHIRRKFRLWCKKRKREIRTWLKP